MQNTLVFAFTKIHYTISLFVSTQRFQLFQQATKEHVILEHTPTHVLVMTIHYTNAIVFNVNLCALTLDFISHHSYTVYSMTLCYCGLQLIS